MKQPNLKPKRTLNLAPEERERRRVAGRERMNKAYAEMRAEQQQMKDAENEYRRTTCPYCDRPYDILQPEVETVETEGESNEIYNRY